MIVNKKVQTSHCDIAVSQTGGKGAAILLIHGNSSCKEVFRAQMESPLGEANRMIAIDLPGHGDSGDALDCRPGDERRSSLEGGARQD